MLSTICREFGCLPSAALRELDETPAGLIADILEQRGFADAWRHVNSVKKESELQDSPMVQFALDVQFKRAAEALAEKRATLGEKPLEQKKRERREKKRQQSGVVD